MRIRFTNILYSNHTGYLTLVFENPEEGESFSFAEHEFKFISDNVRANLDLVDYGSDSKINHDETFNYISGVRQNEDFDYILCINDNVFLKIFYFPDESGPDGVIQTFAIYTPGNSNFLSISEDYQRGVDVEF